MTSLRGFDTPICFAAAVVCPDITHLTRFDGELAKFVRVPPRVLKDSLKIEFVTCMIHTTADFDTLLIDMAHQGANAVSPDFSRGCRVLIKLVGRTKMQQTRAQIR